MLGSQSVVLVVTGQGMVSSADHKVIHVEEFDGPSMRSYGGIFFFLENVLRK